MTGALIISLLHGLIPSHWLPIVAIAKKEKWPIMHTFRITIQAGLAHSLSTVIVGILIAFIGIKINETAEIISSAVAGGILILMGIWFLSRHFHHHHFHLDNPEKMNRKKLVLSLMAAMFFSPCLEITGFYLTLAKSGWWYILVLSIGYVLITLMSMSLWVFVGHHGLKKLDSHKWEHNSGIITGIVMIATGILMLIWH